MTSRDPLDRDPDPHIPVAVRDALRAAHHIAAFTGAGVSAESGIPTFREAQTGLWERFRPEDLATPEAFAQAPERVWQWYTWRRGLVRAAEPNPGHVALSMIERIVPRFTLITQNIDGLHARAGSRNIIELHGNIERNRCSREGRVVEVMESAGTPPLCPVCGAPVRPDVVWFGEVLPLDALRAAEAAARDCDLFLAVGTSSVVYPAAALPLIALEAGAPVIEVNPEATPLSCRTGVKRLTGGAGRILPAIIRAVWPEAGTV